MLKKTYEVHMANIRPCDLDDPKVVVDIGKENLLSIIRQTYNLNMYRLSDIIGEDYEAVEVLSVEKVELPSEHSRLMAIRRPLFDPPLSWVFIQPNYLGLSDIYGLVNDSVLRITLIRQERGETNGEA